MTDLRQNSMEEPTSQHNLDSTNHIQTFVIHFFRSETGREMAWRQRLDVTTSAAVVATGGMLSFSFTRPDIGHIILLVNVLLLFLILQIEARRYQIYAQLNYRVRRIEEDYIAPLFNQITLEPKDIDYEPHIDPGLVESLLEHKSPLSRFEAAAWRLRSIYIYLLGTTYVIWLIRILYGHADQPLLDYINQQARVGSISGSAVFFLFTAVMLTALILSVCVAFVSEENHG